MAYPKRAATKSTDGFELSEEQARELGAIARYRLSGEYEPREEDRSVSASGKPIREFSMGVLWYSAKRGLADYQRARGARDRTRP